MLWAFCNPAAQPTTKKERKKQASYKRIYSVYSECEKDTIEKYDHDFYEARNFQSSYAHTHSISFDEETNKLTVV